MADFKWEGNTKEIFDKAVGLSPKPFQKQAQKAMTEAMVKKIGEDGTVTE